MYKTIISVCERLDRIESHFNVDPLDDRTDVKEDWASVLKNLYEDFTVILEAMEPDDNKRRRKWHAEMMGRFREYGWTLPEDPKTTDPIYFDAEGDVFNDE